MATIKSFTSLEQSRKLAKILPLESADMKILPFTEREYRIVPINDIAVCGREDEIYAWSLSALFGILQYPTLFQRADRKWGCTVWIDATMPYSVEDKDDPIDACVAMIEKLYKLSLL